MAFMIGCTLVLLFSLLSSVLPVVHGLDNNECVTIEGRKALLKHLELGDVLVKIDKESPSGVVEEMYEDLCNRYKSSPGERIGNFVIGRINVSDDNKKSKNLVKILQVDNKDSWPIILLITKGTTDIEKAAKDALATGDSATKGVIKYVGGADNSIDDVLKFIEDKTNVRVGTFVYHLPIMDKLASKLVEIIKNEDPLDGPTIQQKALKIFYIYTSKLLTLVMYRNDNVHDLAKVYSKAFTKIEEVGDLSYIEKQSKRIESMLEDSSTKLKVIKKEEMSQKLHILEKFLKPVEVSKEDERKFLFSFGVNIVLIVSLIVSVIFLFIPDTKSKKDDEDQTKEEANTEKKDDDANGDGDENVTNGSSNHEKDE